MDCTFEWVYCTVKYKKKYCKYCTELFVEHETTFSHMNQLAQYKILVKNLCNSCLRLWNDTMGICVVMKIWSNSNKTFELFLFFWLGSVKFLMAFFIVVVESVTCSLWKKYINVIFLCQKFPSDMKATQHWVDSPTSQLPS